MAARPRGEHDPVWSHVIVWWVQFLFYQEARITRGLASVVQMGIVQEV